MENLSTDNKDLGEYSKFLLNEKKYTSISLKERKDILKDSLNTHKLKILRILCQRPYFTGSGINLVNLTKRTKKEKIKQSLIFGHPVGEDIPLTEFVNLDHMYPVLFQNPSKPELNADLSFPVPGMSDKMPYPSTRFSSFNNEMLEMYLKNFAEKIKDAVEKFNPHIIHTHHLWLVTALARTICPKLPIITTTHNTALRQLILSPKLKQFVVNPIHHLDFIAVNNINQKQRVVDLYGFKDKKDLNPNFFLIGQGINAEIFYPPQDDSIKGRKKKRIIYTGKLAFSKGVPQLIEAFKKVVFELEESIELIIVGSGIGDEKEEILKMSENWDTKIHFLGQIKQLDLAEIFRNGNIFVLPSFYDGFPKVMLEALASGCKVIITELPGIKEMMNKIEGSQNHIHFLKMPKMKTIDEPKQEELPKFIKDLKDALIKLLKSERITEVDKKFSESIRDKFGGESLFKKYLRKYKELKK